MGSSETTSIKPFSQLAGFSRLRLEMRHLAPSHRRLYGTCRLITAGLIVVLLAGCGRQQAASSGDKLQVVTTMAILQDMISRVGGDLVEVRNILPPGAGPESYQPKPGDAAAISAAKIVFYNGTGLEGWLNDLFTTAGGTNQPRISLSEGLPAIGASEEFNSGNPHFWLDPQYGMIYVERIRDGLSVADPEHAAAYRANADTYLAELRALDSRLLEQANTVPIDKRKLITNHDAFPYFAQRYGFEVIGTILPSADTGLSAGQVKQLIDLIKAQNVQAIFAESQFKPEITQQLAKDAGVKTVATLYTDTLDEHAPTYMAMLEYNMNQIVSALLSTS
jgi:ABC-type Zn uptake system ZnuABC Zn-binding protein ZnuA